MFFSMHCMACFRYVDVEFFFVGTGECSHYFFRIRLETSLALKDKKYYKIYTSYCYRKMLFAQWTWVLTVSFSEERSNKKIVFGQKVVRIRYTIMCMVLREENVLFCMVLCKQE